MLTWLKPAKLAFRAYHRQPGNNQLINSCDG